MSKRQVVICCKVNFAYVSKSEERHEFGTSRMCKGLFYHHWEGRNLTQCRFNDLLSCSCWSWCYSLIYLFIYLHAIFTYFFFWFAPLDLPALVTTVFLELSWLGRDLFVHLYLSYYGHWLSGMFIRCAAIMLFSDEFHIFILVASEPWKVLVYVTGCRIHALFPLKENASS